MSTRVDLNARVSRVYESALVLIAHRTAHPGTSLAGHAVVSYRSLASLPLQPNAITETAGLPHSATKATFYTPTTKRPLMKVERQSAEALPSDI